MLFQVNKDTYKYTRNFSQRTQQYMMNIETVNYFCAFIYVIKIQISKLQRGLFGSIFYDKASTLHQANIRSFYIYFLWRNCELFLPVTRR